MSVLYPEFNPEQAYIFCIIHVDNVPWILDHDGLQCQNNAERNPNHVNIGSMELIDKRTRRHVPVPPGGTLSDYVPFYFTPFSIMMYNIHTGHNVKRRDNSEIVMLVSSVPRLRRLSLPFLFTNQHAYSVDADFYDGSGDLGRIDWGLLQRRDFKTEHADPGKQSRYQAEALVHRHVPLEALSGIVCCNDTVKHSLETLIAQCDIQTTVTAFPRWYY